jgi:hypothetical protein
MNARHRSEGVHLRTNQKAEARSQKLETGSAIFQFPVSSFIRGPTSRPFLVIFFALMGGFGNQETVRFKLLKMLTPLYSVDS